jgi:branched-chain amino acid transport system permease protein
MTQLRFPASVSFSAPAWRWVALAVFFVAGWFVLGALPAAAIAVVILALFYSSAGSSFNLLYGSLGIFSLAQPVFVAVGGYASSYLYVRYGVSPWLGMLAAMLCAAILAVPIGFIAMRRPGTVVTALVTLIVSEAATPILSAITPLGGPIGLYIPVKSGTNWGALQFATGVPFARLFLALNVIIIAGLMWFGRSRAGLWATAIKDSPDAASASGVPVLRMRLSIFIVSAMIAAVPGVLFAQYNLLVNADLFLGDAVLFQLLVVALVGGSARPWGTLVGALVMTELSQYLSNAAGDRPGIGPLTFAAAFLVMALVMPRGISGTWAAFVTARRARAVDGGGSGPAPPDASDHQDGNAVPLASGLSRDAAETETPTA